MERKNLSVYDNMVAAFPEIQRKGKNNPYTSMNGNMFSFLDKEGMISLRLGKEDLKEATEKYGAGPSIQYGATMREYALFPDEFTEDEKLLHEWFARSIKYAKSLKPKPTKKPKK